MRTDLEQIVDALTAQIEQYVKAASDSQQAGTQTLLENLERQNATGKENAANGKKRNLKPLRCRFYVC